MSEASGSVSASAESAAEAELRSQIDSGDFEIDLDAIAVAAGSAAAAGGCAALGMAAAAPLCAYVGGEVTGWAMDNVVGPVADFIGGLFSSEPPEETLVEYGNDLQRLIRNIETPIADHDFRDGVQQLLRLAAELGLQYSSADALRDLRAAGLNLIERPDLEGSAAPVIVGLPVHRQAFVAVRDGGSWTYEARGSISPPIWSPNWIGWFRSQYAGGFSEDQAFAWVQEYMVPWYTFALGSALPTVAVWLEARAIAEETRRRMWDALAALPTSEQEALADWAALAALSPEEQEQLRQWAKLLELSQTERDQLRAISGQPMPVAERERILEGYTLATPQPNGKRAAVALGASAALTGGLYLLPRFLL